MQAPCGRFVAASLGEASRLCLLSYSSNGTPPASRRRIKCISGSRAVVRLTKRSDEYHVHNAMGMYRDSMSHSRFSIILDNPRPMTAGKAAAAEIAFALEMLALSILAQRHICATHVVRPRQVRHPSQHVVPDRDVGC